ncbi:MGH1-like glycoside hydrolase domain-containing protein [Tropicimonas sp.]|uniref:MGH1-like glycoside hydrolase domain-containing protein n=1 Tax=Tropicimonas sp. TaxID=2067044 RepID=UPI003A89A3C1
MKQDLINAAREVLRGTDRGSYTVPTNGLYPFQWNWDSVLSALGFAHFDEARAWTEIETLMAHQWPDGMVPHIIFHQMDDGYFPGPEVWNTGRPVPTSGISQPPVAGFAVRRIHDRARDKAMSAERARALLPRIHAWHEWFYRHRDPQGTGLVAIIHPWESGRDNSVDWDDAFTRVPTEGVQPFRRRDTAHANPEHRPTDEQYKRYIWLVQHFRNLNWDNARLHDASPFRMVDPGFNAILIRSCSDLAVLADELGEPDIARQSRAHAERGIAAMEILWNDALGQYACFDRAAGKLIDSPSVGGLLAAFCAIPQPRAAAIAARIGKLGETVRFLVPSHDPQAPEYDGKRYWRGPVWLIVNYMIADGLGAAGQTAMARRIEEDSIRLIEQSGFAEYYDPITAEPCGGGSFTWTAAMVIEILSTRTEAA